MADELIDIYDSEMNLLGTAMKSQADNESLWRKIVHCWVVDGDKVWLQLRGKDRLVYPALLDISVAGHLMTGETAKQAAIREFEDDFGLAVTEADFEKLFTYRLVESYKGREFRAFCPTYVVRSQADLSELKLQTTEVDGIFEAQISDLIDLFDGDACKIKVCGYKRSPHKKVERSVTIKDFAPHGESYYLKVFNTLDRLIG